MAPSHTLAPKTKQSSTLLRCPPASTPTCETRAPSAIALRRADDRPPSLGWPTPRWRSGLNPHVGRKATCAQDAGACQRAHNVAGIRTDTCGRGSALVPFVLSVSEPELPAMASRSRVPSAPRLCQRPARLRMHAKNLVACRIRKCNDFHSAA